eukprot:5724455-Prymnesium_polylepis.3
MDAGYTVAELREGGYSVEEIKNAGVDGENMLAGGFSVSDLKSGGFTAIDLKSAGVSGLLRANFKLQEVKYAFPGMVISADMLRASGWDVRRVHDEGFLPEALLHGGFTLRELFTAGLPKASKLYHEQSVSLELLRDAGLDPDDIDVRESLFGNYGFRKHIFPTSELLRVGVKRKNGGDITYVCESDDSPKSEHYFGRFGGSEKCESCGKKRLVRSLHTNPSVLFAAERLAHSVRRPVLPKIGKAALCTASPLPMPGTGRRGALHVDDTAGWSSRRDAWSEGPSCRLWYLPAPLKRIRKELALGWGCGIRGRGRELRHSTSDEMGKLFSQACVRQTRGWDDCESKQKSQGGTAVACDTTGLCRAIRALAIEEAEEQSPVMYAYENARRSAQPRPSPALTVPGDVSH